MNEENLVKHYENLFRFQETDYRSKNVRKVIKKFLQNGNVLDVGCGTGHLVRELDNEGREVVGIEPTKDLFEFSKKVCEKDKRIKLYNVGGMDLKKLKRKFDNVICVDVIEHVEDDAGIIKSIYDVTNKNSLVIILVPAFRFLYGERDKLIGHYRRYSKRELIEKLENNGFEVIKSRYWNTLGFFPYFIFEKVFHMKIPEKHRYEDKKGLNLLLNKLLDFWFKVVENNISFGFGLSLIVVGKRKD
ncbi:class I SAM-dependent methyltransferase [Candidatus Woesearchaeota archaeon]|nr:class I SAM-dependent methyltransferase [Candidatus Woesearchaeota archaeon]